MVHFITLMSESVDFSNKFFAVGIYLIGFCALCLASFVTFVFLFPFGKFIIFLLFAFFS